MINDHQSPMDKMFATLNEKATYQQCIEGVLTELDKFLNGYSRNIIKFLICGRIPITSKSSMLVWQMFLGIVVCLTASLTRQINYAKLAFELKNFHSLDMFKNRLQNWHYPKSACQICWKFFFFSIFYNAVTKFWRPINKYSYYCNY